MVALTRMVINNIEHDGDSCFVESLDHVSEFKILPIVITSGGILRMRCEEVQRHIAPIVALLRIALKYRHQFDDCYPEFLQIRDLFHQAGVGAGTRRMYARIWIFREALYMKFIDDCVRFGVR